MKELSIEQKAQRYNEAIKRGLDYIKHTPATEMVTRQDIFEAIFPELKEVEGEKIRKALIRFHKSTIDIDGIKGDKIVSWLEKQDKKDKVNCPQNHQDVNHQNGCIVYEDFRGGEGFYKVNLDYLNKKQVEKIKELTNTWNKDSRASDENIKNCIGMCLTDVSEQRFKDYNITLRDCLAWLEKIGEQNPAENAEHCYIDDKLYLGYEQACEAAIKYCLENLI